MSSSITPDDSRRAETRQWSLMRERQIECLISSLHELFTLLIAGCDVERFSVALLSPHRA